MKIAIFFEASGIVRDAFRARGFDATSIDLRPTQRPGPHIQGDVFDHLADGWDMAVMHPDCTYMARSGLHWNARVQGRVLMTDRSIHQVRILMDAPIERWALENPIGCIGTRIRPADQIIQPNWFGDDASKATCLWLKGLPRLKQTGHAKGRMVAPADGPRPDTIDMFEPERTGMIRRYSNQTDTGQNRLPETVDRWAKRSETFPGFADAMADQWGTFLLGLSAKKD